MKYDTALNMDRAAYEHLCRSASAVAQQSSEFRRARMGEFDATITHIVMVFDPNASIESLDPRRWGHAWWDDFVVAVCESGHITQSNQESEQHTIRSLRLIHNRSNLVFIATRPPTFADMPSDTWAIWTPSEYESYISPSPYWRKMVEESGRFGG